MPEHQLQMIRARSAPSRLVADYLDGAEKACRFFGGHFSDQGRLERLAAMVGPGFDRPKAAKVLASQPAFGLVPDGQQLLERFVRKGGFLVCTGQQPVLFGGPLFVLYKALTIIKIAIQAEKLLEVPVLPVFWNASEDHDFDEISSVSLPGPENRLETLGLGQTSRPGTPACLIQPGDQVSGLLERFVALTPETEFRPWLVSLLEDSYRPDRSLGQAFSVYLARLMAGFGLFVVEACSPALRQQSAPLVEAELFDSAAGYREVRQASDELAASGYHIQIKPLEGDTSLFLILDGCRDKLQLAGDGNFRLKKSRRMFSPEDLRGLLKQDPSCFSPGALLRPLVEARLFKPLCYAAGPGEIAYYAQMAGLYRLRGLNMPVIHPRMAGVLIEGKISKVLDKYRVRPEDLEQGVDALAARLASAGGPQARVLEEIAEFRLLLKQRCDRIRELAAEVDPTLAPAAEVMESSLQRDVDRLEKKLSSAARRSSGLLVSQLGKAALHLLPEGEPQERTLAGIYYLARYGEGLLDFLFEKAEVGLG